MIDAERKLKSQKPAIVGLQIRWLIRRDMPNVMRIENECFQFAWTEQDFIDCLRQRCCIGMVVEVNQKVVGYMIYELSAKYYTLFNLAVDPEWHRNGIGTAMIAKMFSKLTTYRRDMVETEVRETNLKAQLFFQAMGFRAVSIVKGRYDDTAEDAYVMRYQLPR